MSLPGSEPSSTYPYPVPTSPGTSPESEPPLVTEQELQIGYRGATACAAAGITYRQLDYWARTGLVEPSIRTAHGSGSARLYGFRDILVLKIVKRLLDTGVSLQNIRTAVHRQWSLTAIPCPHVHRHAQCGEGHRREPVHSRLFYGGYA